MDANKVTKWTLFGVGAGAAVAYFFHPTLGKKRRAALANEATRFMDKAAHAGKESLRDSRHRLTGLAATLRAHFRQQPAADRVLEERIRSRIGRVVSHPHKIHVVCDSGVATLWGLVLEEEFAPLIEAVEAVPGVAEVLNHLEIAKPEGLPTAGSNTLRDARNKVRLNWSPSKRLALGAGGLALVLRGLQRKDKLGKLLETVGAGLLVRSLMQKHLRATLSLSEASPGFELERTVRINAPISDIFDFWTNPENYPKAFSHVTKIERLAENLFRWTIAGPAGVPIGWEGMITRVVPNTLVEWKSLPGSVVGNFGMVRFDPNYDASTRVNIRMFYRPPAGILGRFLAEMLGADAGQVLDQDLKRLKHLFENDEFVGEQKEARTAERELLKTATT